MALARRYGLLTAQQAREIARKWLFSIGLQDAIAFGLPEVDDRYHIWRVPLVTTGTSHRRVGEIVIDARSSLVLTDRTTKREILEARLLGKNVPHNGPDTDRIIISSIRNTVLLGDCEFLLGDLPAESIGLIFTSPPYYNARPEYGITGEYENANIWRMNPALN